MIDASGSETVTGRGRSGPGSPPGEVLVVSKQVFVFL